LEEKKRQGDIKLLELQNSNLISFEWEAGYVMKKSNCIGECKSREYYYPGWFQRLIYLYNDPLKFLLSLGG
jgi:hypothetical protein